MPLLVPGLMALSLFCGLLPAAHAAGEDAAPAPSSLPGPEDPALRDTERQALITFYEALGGPDWIQRDFWESDQPVGKWHGVETDTDGRVVRLTIYDNNLEGELSPAVCKLEWLHTPHLSFNKISGALPDELGECRALKNLWLKGNKLTGRIPDSVALLPELEYLDVHANALSGALPSAWDTPHLTIFRAEDNEISGALPGALFEQASLEQVFSAQQRARRRASPHPPRRGEPSFPAAREQQADRANSKGCRQIVQADRSAVDRNQLTGPIPESLVDAPALQVLRLDHNLLSGTVPAGLAEHLTVFDVSHNPDLEAP